MPTPDSIRSWIAARSSPPRRSLRGLLSGLTVLFGLSLAAPGRAAERLIVRLGPLQPSVSISDLEQFADTGEIPAGLRLYTPLLTSKVRQALNSRLRLDPNVGDKLVEDLLHSSAGERFLNTLQVVMPDTEAAQLQLALMLAAKQRDGMSLLSFLRTFPSYTVTIDATSAVAFASQLNLPYWQSQTLSSVLDRELTVKSQTFRTDFDPTQTGPYWVWKQTMTLRDYQRDRTIPVDLYWSRRTKGPLVIISHGFGADRRFLGYLAYHLASYGVTVAAVEHPASNVSWLISDAMNQSTSSKRANILPATEFVDRPKDVSFLLDRLSLLNRFSSTLRGKFDTNHVVVIGHSLGGHTALALAGATLNLKHLRQFCDSPTPISFSPADLLQCNAADLPAPQTSLRDRRVIGAIVLNPVIGRLFDAVSLAQVNIPILMLAGTNDTITPAVSQQFLPFTQLRHTKYLLTAIGGTHLSVGDPTNLNHALTQSIFIRERPDAETEPLRQLLRGVSLAFIKQFTPEASHYTPFLTPSYAQSFSTANIQLRLNSDLPPNFANWLRMAALPMEQLVSSTLAQRRSQPRGICDASVGCLLSSLPLVMFILPGGLPLAESQLFRRRRKSIKSTRKGAEHHG